MDKGRIIQRMSKESGVSKSEIARAIGVSRQRLYQGMRGNMEFEQMLKAIERCGYVLYIGRIEDGEVKRVKRLSEFVEGK